MKKEKIKYLTYKLFLIFMVSSVFLTFKTKKSSETLQILYCDETFKNDPNFKIENSYIITDIHTMNIIVDDILKCEKKSNEWYRSKESMMVEWIIHNICYELGIKRERTADVDFSNSEENLFLLRLKKY